ncbi:MAG: histidinol-phosphatase [Gemmatimonadaceae bacterium]
MQAVADVARLAGTEALRHYGKNVSVETKGDGSPVTIADRGAEQLARNWIETRFPDDGIMGEEFGVIRPEARRRWIIDPIDGTKSFVRTVPLWGTLVAIAEGDSVIAGAAYFPALDEIGVAAVGAGSWWNGSRCTVSSVSDISAATVLTSDTRFAKTPERGEGWNMLSDTAAISRTWGDCYGYLLVATGRAEVMVDAVVADWDTAALMPLITEAGGSFTSWDGVETAFGASAIATNAALAREAREILSNRRPPNAAFQR